MDKFRAFFLRTNLLTEQQFNELCDYVTFTKPQSSLLNPNKVIIELITRKPIKIELFKNLITSLENFKDKLEIRFTGKPIVVDKHIVANYLNYFLEKHQIHNILIKSLVNRADTTITDSGLLVIKYENKAELDAIKEIEIGLLKFFKTINFFITSIGYELNKDLQDIEILKRLKHEKMLMDLNPKATDDVKLTNVRNYNDQILKKFKDATIKINEIVYTGDEQYFIVTGEIFKIETSKTKNGTHMFKIFITDYEDTMVLTAFASIRKASVSWGHDVNLPLFYLNSFKNGDWIKARIKVDNSKYSNNEVSGITNFIALIPRPKHFIREEKFETRPRIELLAHTNMSMLDGIIDPEDLINRAQKYHWPAIGIADRFNVHAYPTIMQKANQKGAKTKIAYGVECNVINRNINIIKNPIDQAFDAGTYVIFDIETTGLNNEFDEITEFGAIKVVNGVITDEVDWFVGISKPLPYKIKEKTHITDDMLKGQPSIKQRLKEIINFFSDAILVAHNATNFDIRFINKKLQQNNMPLITNTVVDTLLLSYAINTHMTRHNLGAICRDAKIIYNEETAHRANFDARVLYDVWLNMLLKMQKLGIKNIIEINEKLQNKQLQYNQFGHFVEIYAKNQQGIKDIYHLVSSSHTENLHRRPRVYIDDIKNNRQNFLITNHPTESDVFDVALNGTNEQLAMAMMFYDYIFIAPITVCNHLLNRQDISDGNLKKVIEKIIRVASEVNKKVIAVSDGYYLDPIDAVAHKVYIYTKQPGGGSHRFYRYGENNDVLPDLHIRTTKEMLEEFKFIKDEKLLNKIVIDNSYDFIDRIDNDIRPLKSGSFRPKISDVGNKLQEAIRLATINKYGENVDKSILERIEHELKMVIDNDYAIIYWICHLLVKKAYEDKHIVGSRGSVGSSVIAYLIGISEVNPLPPHYYCKKCKHIDFDIPNHADGFDFPPKKCSLCGEVMQGDGHNIPFETFLGFEGDPKVPDIDLNFSGDYQPIAHRFIREMFGQSHTFRAGTISTVAEKTAFGWVRSYFEMTKPNDYVKNSTIEWIASKCINVKRTTGQHPGGIIIVPKEYDILDFSPFNYPADDNSLDWYTTHFDFNNIHDNLLKFDILGHDDPTSLMMLQEITGVDFKTIPFQDDKVMQLYSSLDSIGINPSDLLGEKVASLGLPEFGTQFVRRMLMVTQPKSFADLVRVSGLSHGTDVWEKNAHELIEKNGLKLSEVITCRDDIMNFLIRQGVDHINAFKIMEAVRKGKGLKPEWMDLMRQHQVKEWYIDSCNKIKYLFPKAHATAYVMMSWRIGWFKVYYPLAFYATYFSIRPAVFDLTTIVKGPDVIREKLSDIKTRLANYQTKKDVKTKEKELVTIYELALEMYARGFDFKNIDLEKSVSKRFVIDGKSLIPPFTSIDGLGEGAAESIVQARKQNPFTSKADLMERCKINKSILGFFEESGITANLDEDNQLSLF